MMKNPMSLVFLLLLCSLYQISADTHAVVRGSEICCAGVTAVKIPLRRITSISRTSGSCALEAVIVETTFGKKFCVDPKDDWFKSHMKAVNPKPTRESSRSETTSIKSIKDSDLRLLLERSSVWIQKPPGLILTHQIRVIQLMKQKGSLALGSIWTIRGPQISNIPSAYGGHHGYPWSSTGEVDKRHQEEFCPLSHHSATDSYLFFMPVVDFCRILLIPLA